MKFSRCVLSINVIFCLITLGQMMLYVCVIFTSPFSTIAPSPKSRLIDFMSLVLSPCNVLINATGTPMLLFMFCVVMELPRLFVPTPICIRATATTILLLYAVAVIGYIPGSVYLVFAAWFTDLISPLPLPKSQCISSIDPNVFVVKDILFPVFWFAFAGICRPFLACVLLPTMTVVCA